MPRGLSNWTYKQIVKVLESFHFSEISTNGSHVYFSGSYLGIPRMVTVPKHKTIATGTLKGIIAQSGIPQEIWRKFYSKKNSSFILTEE